MALIGIMGLAFASVALVYFTARAWQVRQDKRLRLQRRLWEVTNG